MSFEGRYQILCKNGHLRGCDCYEEPMFVKNNEDEEPEYPLWTCSCGATAVWWNLVDETNGAICTAWDEEAHECRDSICNGSFYCSEKQQVECKQKSGRIDGFVELEVDQESRTETCKCCGHTKVTREKTYKIPEGVGHRVPMANGVDK